MNKSIVFITTSVIVMALLLGILSFVYFQPTVPYTSSSDSDTTPSTNSLEQQAITSDSKADSLPGKISLSTLAEHNAKEDCWVGYRGKAYDVTSFLPNHPGGVSPIARNCGTSTQFEEAFKKKHGDSKADYFIKVAIYKGDLE